MTAAGNERLHTLYRQFYDIEGPASRTTYRGPLISEIIFKWLLCGDESLSASALIEGVTRSMMDLEDVSATNRSISWLLGYTHDLASYYSKPDHFDLIHDSVREYLQSHPKYRMEECHSLAARTCLDTITTVPDGAVPQISHSSFSRYAVTHWAYHVEASQLDTKDPLYRPLRDFLSPNNPAFIRWAESAEAIKQEYKILDRFSASLSTPPCPMFAVCAWGLESVCKPVLTDTQKLNEARNIRGESLLYVACQYGHDLIVRELLAGGMNPNDDTKGYYRYAICAAAAEGHLIVVRTLIEYGADVNCRGDATPLYLAARFSDNADLVQLLIKHGADVDYYDDEGKSALTAAVRARSVDTAKVLLRYGADVNATGDDELLHKLSSDPTDVEMLQLLLEHKAAVDATDHGMTPLAYAARAGNIAAARILLAHGASVNGIDSWLTPLYYAAYFSAKIELVRMLLEHGADASYRDDDKFTVVCAVVSIRNLEILRLLLEHGAKCRTEGWGPLSSAVADEDNTEMVEMLLKYGANIDERDSETNAAPLLTAIRNNHINISRVLLTRGADPYHRARFIDFHTQEETLNALGLALKNQSLDMVNLLLEFGVVPDTDQEALLDQFLNEAAATDDKAKDLSTEQITSSLTYSRPRASVQ